MLQNPAKRPGQIAVKWVLEFKIKLNVFCWVFVFYFHLFFFEFIFIFPLPPWRETELGGDDHVNGILVYYPI